MLHKAWNSKGEMPFCFPRSSIKFQGHMVQNITDIDPNWAFPDYRPVAAFKSLRFALLVTTWSPRDQWVKNWLFVWRHHLTTILSRGQWFKSSLHPPPPPPPPPKKKKKKKKKVCLIILFIILPASVIKWIRNQQSSACPPAVQWGQVWRLGPDTGSVCSRALIAVHCCIW